MFQRYIRKKEYHFFNILSLKDFWYDEAQADQANENEMDIDTGNDRFRKLYGKNQDVNRKIQDINR